MATSLGSYGQTGPKSRAASSRKKPSRNAPLVDPRLPLDPPSVQNYRRYSPSDQQDFSTTVGAYQYQHLPQAKPAKPRRLKPGAVVFGWHPYWMSNAYVNYDFSLLTHVAYYGYQANNLGELSLAAPPDQGPENLIREVRRQNPACKVLLTISYPAAEGARSLLDANQMAAQNRLLAAIVQHVEAAKADGVNLDFGPPDQKPQLFSLLQRQLQQQTDTLLARQGKLSASSTRLQKQQALLAPAAPSLLVLAAAKDSLADVAYALGQEQNNLALEIEAHRKLAPQPPKPPGLIWGTVVQWFDLDEKAKADFKTAKEIYERAEKQLTDQKTALKAQNTDIRKQQQLNARLTREYIARQETQQPGLAENKAQLTQLQELQTANQSQNARKQQAKQDLRQRARSYQYVVPPSMRPLTDHSQPLQDFIARLAVRLWARDSSYLITLNVPAVDSTGTYRNLQAVQHLVRLFIVKAFDYTPYNQIVPGALAPLHPSDVWGQHSIATSVDYYLKQGTVPRRQLVVGFPHLAKVWKVDSLGNQVVGDKYPPTYWTNWQLRPRLPQEEIKLDLASLSRTSSGLAPDQFGLPAPQAWWEDSASLAPKYAWLMKQRLAGVGIWALGYDDGSPQVWNLLRASFTEPVIPISATIPAAQGPLARLYGLRHVLLLSGVVVIGFLLVGLLVALFRRADSLIPNPPLLSVVALLIGLCTLCVAGYLVWFGQLVVSGWLLVGTGTAVLLLLLLLYRRYWRRQILP
ncbi:glycosyl hydrolase family 18 protein [Hymenobacter elongatus]|uniref:chitinase n=1 Tax=Hymenobacter elongatus TaxID=877208 RepID=A0A4Z0PGY1_9BACT|nr:glycosyl hydrolase family 18 protein [Hymenobacter elongatus]TGE14001.1 hypothetical protein E5J99_17935 [Hymenobacter elongatus]